MNTKDLRDIEASRASFDLAMELIDLLRQVFHDDASKLFLLNDAMEPMGEGYSQIICLDS